MANQSNLIFRRLAGYLSNSFLLRTGKLIHESNLNDRNLNHSAKAKILSNLYLIIKDFSSGDFPPHPTDQQEVYQNESNLLRTIPEANIDQTYAREMRKPFWPSEALWLSGFEDYLKSFSFILKCLRKSGITPPAKLLELGCGSAWMAEFFALYGYEVVATTLPSMEFEIAQIRADLLQKKHCGAKLTVVAAAMETATQAIGSAMPFDAVIIHEALHHAFDWRATIHEAYRALRPGGFFLICKEPNAAHTFICYRSAKILKTHEIGLHKSELVNELKNAGFTKVTVLRPLINDFISPLWIQAQK